MEILDKLVLPHSGSNLELLKYLLTLALLIFEIFAGALFGSAILSLIFRSKAKKDSSMLFGRLSLDYIDLIIQNRTMGIGLGIVPFVSVIIIFIQLMHGTNSALSVYLILSFVLFCVSLVLLNFYRHTAHLKNVFDFFKTKVDKTENSFQSADFHELDNEALHINNKSAVWGIVFLFFSIWVFAGALNVAVDSSKWQTSDSIFGLLFSFGTIIKFLHFITVSFAMAGIAFIVKYFYWDKAENQDEEYTVYAKRLNTAFALIFTILQPVFLVINMLITPHDALSALPFGVMLTAAILSFVLINILYKNLKENNYGKASLSFYIFLIIFGLIIFKEQTAFGIAAKDQIQSLAANYEKLEAEHAANEVKGPAINAKEIYQTKCAACHKFDTRLVGPPHKEVLLKYLDKKEAMVKFLLNPTKINPEYPAMPSQGLTPKEAQAIVEYLFTEYGSQLK